MLKSKSQILLLLLQVAWSCEGDVEWVCGEEGLIGDSALDLIDEELERNRAVRQIEDKIQDLHRLAEQIISGEHGEEELLKNTDEDPKYEFNESFFPHPQYPRLRANHIPALPGVNQIQPSASHFRVSQTQPQTNAAESFLVQLQPSLSPIQPHNNTPNLFQPHFYPEFQFRDSSTQPAQLASRSQHRSSSISSKTPPSGLQNFLQSHFSSPQPKTLLSQSALQPQSNNSLAKEISRKKLRSYRNSQWASKWYHPVLAGSLRIQIPRHCNKLYSEGTRRDGVYDVIANGNRIEVFCEFEKNGHNWLVFQRREDGSIDFYKSWTQYDTGFGSKTGEFWLGLSNLYELTRVGSYVLRVDLEDFDGDRAFAEYSTFAIESPSYNFRLCVKGYRGNAGDSLSYHNGYPFSTYDRDHDNHYRGRNCAVDDHGAWWYNSCQHSNLNGEYLPRGTINIRGIVWYHWKHNHYSMKSVTMKFRPT